MRVPQVRSAVWWSIFATPIAWLGMIAMAHPQGPVDLPSGKVPRVPGKSLPACQPPATGKPGDASAWLRNWPDDFPFLEIERIADADIYEMVASQADFHMLFDGPADPSFTAISPEDASRYPGHYYRCPEGKTPYLVRAVYGNVGTGGFMIGHVGRKLTVGPWRSHLGSDFVPRKTYFVLNLAFEPEDAYIMAGVAK